MKLNTITMIIINHIDFLRNTTKFEYEFEINENEFDNKKYKKDDDYKTYIDELKEQKDHLCKDILLIRKSIISKANNQTKTYT